MQITGTVTRITYQNPTNGFTIALLDYTQNDGKKQHISIKGGMPALKEGMTVRVDGTPEFSPKYGNSLKVQNWSEQRPTDIEGVKKYLASGLIKNIGEVFADKIVSAFGEETLDVLDNNPERLRDIKGIGKKRIQSIIKAVEEQNEIRDIMIWLKRYDIPNGLAVKIYKKYQGNAVAILEENPYRLSDDIGGVGFRKADQVARLLGIAPDSVFRIRSGLLAALGDRAAEGDTRAATQDLILLTASPDYLDISPDLVAPVLDDPCTEGITVEDGYAYLNRYYRSEYNAARRIAALAAQPGLLPDLEPDFEQIRAKTGMNYSDEQKDAVRSAFRRGFCVLTGGPGTGKTATTNAIITALESHHKRILLAAPTGRAAKRMNEVTGRPASTIHRLLEYNQEGFQHNEENPLDGDFLIVDEASMIDIQLASALLRAVPNGMAVLLVGDSDQLPSVGAGCVLRDIIESGSAAVNHLTQIYRQAATSSIVRNAHRVNGGRLPWFSGDTGDDMQLIEVQERDAIQQTVVDLVCNQIPAIAHIPHEDIQVLCPMRRDFDPIGSTVINRILQQQLNPEGTLAARSANTEYRVGDRVMQVKNDYDKDLFNGDLGTVTRKLSPTEEDNAVLEATFDGVPRRFTLTDLGNLELAYACTIHKSQGSEYKAVVMPVHESQYVMLKRNLLYTGITRAKKLCIIVGTQRAIQMATSREDTHRRCTGLRERIQTNTSNLQPCTPSPYTSQPPKHAASEKNSSACGNWTESLFDETN